MSQCSPHCLQPSHLRAVPIISCEYYYVNPWQSRQVLPVGVGWSIMPKRGIGSKSKVDKRGNAGKQRRSAGSTSTVGQCFLGVALDASCTLRITYDWISSPLTSFAGKRHGWISFQRWGFLILWRGSNCRFRQ